MAEREKIVTTLAIVGSNAERMFRSRNADPANFVFPIMENEGVANTPFGKVGIGYDTQEQRGEMVRKVLLDLSDAPLLRRRSADKPVREIHVNDNGIGVQTVRNFELFVATKHFSR